MNALSLWAEKLLKEEVPEIAEVNIVDVCQCGVDTEENAENEPLWFNPLDPKSKNREDEGASETPRLSL